MAVYTDVTTFARDVMPTITDSISPNLLAQAANIAAHYIDSRLASVYTVPFASPYPGAIVSISNLLTKCVVVSLQQKRAPLQPKPGKQKRDSVDGDCALAILWLDDLAAMRATLPGITPANGASAMHTRDGYQPIFDVDSPLNHQPDRQLVEKVESERDT